MNVIFHISTYSIWEFSDPTNISVKNVTLCSGFTELVKLDYLYIYTLYSFAAAHLMEKFSYSSTFLLLNWFLVHPASAGGGGVKKMD